MASPAALVAHCLELLAPLGHARARRMFGGWGLYVDELFIALISDDRLYLKADPQSQDEFRRAGSEPFSYSSRDRAAVTLGYWSAPDEAMDSPQAMQPWARLAMASAVRARAAKRSDTPRSASDVAPKKRAPRPAAAARQRNRRGSA
ncbi:MAG: TfoX/Sxy family protein [Burkholderiaceae bacterium]|nr:TfoX/Sxy family protein [Burkholderiaceae bacterium]